MILDEGSLSHAADQALAATRDGRGHASNALLVSGSRSATHHPIMVAGPQIGYYYPGLTLEMDLEGPGISQRGAMSAPFPGYIFIGRSQDAAWSLTSAGLDQIDTYVETLCGHSIHRYLFDGKCRAMQFFDAGTLNPGAKQKEITFYRTVHGPVFGYARVHGRLVASPESAPATERTRSTCSSTTTLPMERSTTSTSSSEPPTRRRRPSTRST